MSDEVRIEIDTEDTLYPYLSLSERGNAGPGEGYAVPRELWDTARRAWAASLAAERAVMAYVAERYPDATAVHDWLRDQ